MNILPDKKQKQMGNPELARCEMSREAALLSDRQNKFDPAWQRLSDVFYPNLSDIQGIKTEGLNGWSDGIYDTTPMDAARTCSTGLTSETTPSVEPWFHWTPPQDLNLDEYDEGSLWCGQATETHLNLLGRSNYYSVSGDANMSRTVFGTGVTLIQEGKDSLFNAKTFKIGTYCIDENDEGAVDTFYVRVKRTARQVAQEFGVDSLPEKIRQAYDDNKGKKMDKKFEILYCIRPREEIERDNARKDPANKPFAYIVISMEDKLVIHEGGFDEFPMSASRFDSWGSGTVWGYSPAFQIYRLSCQLNYMTKFMDTIPELSANPRFLIPNGVQGQMDLRPGGFTVYDPIGGKPEEWMTKANFQMGDVSIKMKQDMIKKAFFNDVFAMFQDITGQKTAYEISLREAERIKQLSPTFGRLLKEKCEFDLRRTFGIAFRAGAFGKPPDSLIKRDARGNPIGYSMPDIQYTSPLALRLKELQNRSTKDAMQFTMMYAKETGRAQVLDNVNDDVMLRDVWVNGGVPSKYIRPMKQVGQIRQQRQQQVKAQQALEAAKGASEVARNVGKAPQAMQEQMENM